MKVIPSHLVTMRGQIAPLDTEYRRERATARGDSNMRYRWDLFHGARFFDTGFASELYAYANDAHIDTALRAIIPDLRREA